MKFTKSNQSRKTYHQLVPGGSTTYSKGDDQFPKLSPGFFVKAQGAYVWDVDGNKFLDWTMGVRTTILGHGYRPVVAAVKKQIDFGANYGRPSIYELELAKVFTQLIPCAEMVKFTKDGSTATSSAVKLSRAYTKRDLVAMPAHSYNGSDDWGIASTPLKSGIPKAIQKMTVTFEYNDLESVKKLFRRYPKKIACVILEPVTEVAPKNNFLLELKKLCHKNGAVLIFDEVISGFRRHLKGAQYVYKVTPDLAAFGKAMANGFSVSALAGKREIMKLGGIHGPHERVFLMSSTHGAENHAMVAALQAIKEIKKHNVTKHLDSIGQKLKQRLNQIAKAQGLGDVLDVFGVHGSRIATAFQPSDRYNPFQIKTYFFQEIISQGIFFNGYFCSSLAHGQKEIDLTAKAWSIACKKLNLALTNNNLEKKLVGEPVKPTFRKYN